MNYLLGIIFCLTAFHRAAQAAEADVVSTNVTSSSSNCPRLSSFIELEKCCSLKMLFKATPLGFCQKVHARWIKGETDDAAMCGSMCVLADLIAMPEAIQDFLYSFPTGWIQLFENLPIYLNAASQCLSKLSFESVRESMPGNETDSDQDPGCKVDLLGFAECFSRQVFLTCPHLGVSKECQAAKEYLNRPCQYSGLAVESSPRK